MESPTASIPYPFFLLGSSVATWKPQLLFSNISRLGARKGELIYQMGWPSCSRLVAAIDSLEPALEKEDGNKIIARKKSK